MADNRDDYYSSITPDEKSNTEAGAKKLVIKKKIKVRPKKIETEAPKQQTVEGQEISKGTPVEVKKEATLNDSLGKDAKPSRLQVISRSGDTRSPRPSSNRPASWGRPQDRNTRSEKPTSTPSTQSPSSNSSSDDGGFKFKPGFSKDKKPGFSGNAGGANKGAKKSKLYSWGKQNKYKTNFDDDSFRRSNKVKHKKKEEKNIEDIEQNLTEKTGQTVVVGDVLSIKEFSEKIWVPLPKLIAEFMKNSMMMTINSRIDFDTASLIAETFDVKLEKESGEGIGVDDIASWNIKDLLVEDDSSKLIERAPVISIMGHVDHWKTSLLDHIRNAEVASEEAGGITQSIGAYQVERNGKKITFLDTPGHEAFTIMRSRGAKSTDIAILVVAADEWVKPQTIESISHAKEAGIPVIVAINKMDKEWANPDHVKGQLAEHGLTPEDWGGETPMVPVSAQTGFGIDSLLEIILLLAEMQELKANPNRAWVATILESHLDSKFGPVSTVLINTGTMKKGDNIVCGASFWKIKVLKDFMWKSVKEATPGMPVLVVGLDEVSAGWDILQVVSSVDAARQKSVEYRAYQASQQNLKWSQLDILMSRIKSWNLKHLKVVVKADTNGSLEAIKNSLLKLSTDETSVTMIHTGVWNITQGDVLMCGWSSAVLIGFGVSVGPNAKWALEDSGVEYIESKIIYHITDRIEKIVTGMLDPKEVEHILCEAKVGGIFYTSKKFLIVGLIIKDEDTTIEKDALVRVIRGDKMIGKGRIDMLKQWVEEVRRLEWPIECGIKLSGVSDVQEKDILEVYKVTIEK